MKFKSIGVLILGVILLLNSCGPQYNENLVENTPQPSTTYKDTGTSLPASRITPPTETPSSVNWQVQPVVPVEISQRTKDIYSLGQAQHKRPNSFSIIGDCLSTPTYFLTNFDGSADSYNLGEFTYLQDVVDVFHGSFSRVSLSVGRGFNAGSVLSSLWADPNSCMTGESPLDCELRVNQPAFAFILLGTNDASQNEDFEGYMKQIIENTIEKGVVPILATKADNLEGDQMINEIIARLADEYEIPLWNFWLAVQPLPNHGLQEDGIHLTWAIKNYDFSNPVSMENGWPWRNLTFLQVLNFLWESLETGRSG